MESTYYYAFNVQGDIIGIIDSTGTKVVEYTYGAWEDILSVTGTLADTIGQMNPLRYRGYYYDAETYRWIIKDAIKWVAQKVVKPVVKTVQKGFSKVNTTCSIGQYSMITNAPNIENLNGLGYQIGGSASIPIPAPVAISAGREFNIISDRKKDINYYGVSSFKGIAPPIPGVEVHAEWGKTETLSYEFNVFNVMHRAYVKIMEW